MILGIVSFSQPRHVAHEKPATAILALVATPSVFQSGRGTRRALFPVGIVQSTADTAAAPLPVDRATTAFVDSGYAVNRPAAKTDSHGLRSFTIHHVFVLLVLAILVRSRSRALSIESSSSRVLATLSSSASSSLSGEESGSWFDLAMMPKTLPAQSYLCQYAGTPGNPLKGLGLRIVGCVPDSAAILRREGAS